MRTDHEFSPRFRRWSRFGFALALALTGFFGFRVVMTTVFWSDPRHTDQQIESWMPLGYIARSWDVPLDVVFDAINVRPDERRWRRLDRLAETRDVPVGALIDTIDQAIEAYRQARPDTSSGPNPGPNPDPNPDPDPDATPDQASQ